LAILEIGGNDLLGTTTADEFERDLDRLLAMVRRSDRPVLMFELPLPPTRNQYGIIQRRLATKHQATLIPKRIFMGVLAAPGSTLDTVHLSQIGHQRMADAVWNVIQQAYPSTRTSDDP
jgi:acyl-CoA thioesterase-1